jgi:hypothetical protein
MKKIILGLVVLLAFPALSFALTAPAPCDVVAAPFLTISQVITNDPDSGVKGDWAVDAFTENTSVFVGSDGVTFCATSVADSATFVTKGGISPEAGVALAEGVTGTFSGAINYTLGALVDPNFATTTLTAVTLDPSSTAGFYTWIPTYFTSHSVTTYSLTYVTEHNGTWTQTEAGDTGDITGDIFVPAPVVVPEPAPVVIVSAGNGAPVGLIGRINTQAEHTVQPVGETTISQPDVEVLRLQVIDLLKQVIALLQRKLALQQ